jgi:integrase
MWQRRRFPLRWRDSEAGGGACRPHRGLVYRAIPVEPASATTLPTVVPKKELVRRWFARPATSPSRCGGARIPAHVVMQLVGRGEAVNVVQALLGHASLSSTQIYIRAAGHQAREAAHALPVRGVLRGIRRDTTSG